MFVIAPNASDEQGRYLVLARSFRKPQRTAATVSNSIHVPSFPRAAAPVTIMGKPLWFNRPSSAPPKIPAKKLRSSGVADDLTASPEYMSREQ